MQILELFLSIFKKKLSDFVGPHELFGKNAQSEDFHFITFFAQLNFELYGLYTI